MGVGSQLLLDKLHEVLTAQLYMNDLRLGILIEFFVCADF